MSAKKRKKDNQKPLLFTPINYKLMGLGLLFLVIGFTAMRIENEVQGVVSLYISPVIIVAGYAIVLYAILKKDHKTENDPSTTNRVS
ncbi:MAG: hypothetical protein U5K72_11860 [Balneolaceae bacterium]|nr:hypothetical protein [Balneolaceae bacterium]